MRNKKELEIGQHILEWIDFCREKDQEWDDKKELLALETWDKALREFVQIVSSECYNNRNRKASEICSLILNAVKKERAFE